MANKCAKIAVLSGKGGTGKTLVSVNLAAAAGSSIYVDCDVEEPNGHLFFKPEIVKEENVFVKVPVVDERRCSGCRACVDFCKLNALAFVGGKVRIFVDVCHPCGGCVLVCPEKAMSEKDRQIGIIQYGVSEQVKTLTGFQNTGEESGVPIIQRLLKIIDAEKSEFLFIDCPPGSSCTVMECVKDADFCILVAEPTLFGVHNLEMVYELVTLFGKPHGVVLNKWQNENDPSDLFCIEKRIPILGQIPFDRELGLLNSNAEIVARKNNQYETVFSDLFQKILMSLR